jgi:aspartate aminotransferase
MQSLIKTDLRSSLFGILGEGYTRLSYANSTENILDALDRRGDFLATRKAA